MPVNRDGDVHGSAVQAILRSGRGYVTKGEYGRRRQFARGRHDAGHAAEGANQGSCVPNFSITGRALIAGHVE
jgi:hypothetical protein